MLTMPKLSDSMEEATIIRWLKSPGEPFARGDALAEIETDKATVVYEAEADGVIAEFIVEEGGTARLGEPIARLNGDGAAPVAPAPTPADSDPVRATPVARRRAVELGVSLHGLSGTGPGGRVTATDVERAATGTAPAVTSGLDRGTVEEIGLTPTQATIARRMEASAAVPVFTVTIEIDMSGVVALRRGDGEGDMVVPSVNDFAVRAAALTLRRFPAFNGSWADGRIERYSRVNVGIAVALDDALLVPTLFDADRKSLTEIAVESRKLIGKARTRSLTPDELSHATFTVSNLGKFGVHSFTAIVSSPQAAILALGGIDRRPVEAEGRIEFRESMLATLSADHRVVYGADGAAFLGHFKSLLERPLSLT